MGSILRIYQHKNLYPSQVLHTGPLINAEVATKNVSSFFFLPFSMIKPVSCVRFLFVSGLFGADSRDRLGAGPPPS